MSHIFISYSHKDREYVHKLHEALQTEGFDVWIDDRIDYGDKWLKVIEKNLDECDAFIIVMSKNSSESEMVQNEITRARDLGKHIFPLLLDGNNWLVVQSRQFVDVRDGSLPTEKFYKRLESVTQRKNKTDEIEAAEKAAREQAEHKAAGHARGASKEIGRQKTVKEDVERFAAEKLVKEKFAHENAERVKNQRETVNKSKAPGLPTNEQKIIRKTSQVEPQVKEPQTAQRKPGTQAAFWIIGLVVIFAIGMFAFNNLNKPTGSVPTSTNASSPTESGSDTASKKYSAVPSMTIDVNKQYFATIKMDEGGEFVIQLYPDKAPIAVNNFVFLAREGYYNGTTFHRVLDGFMAQGGDHTGTGMGGPGYEFVNEDNDLKFDKAGVVGMANSGRDSNGSQFFITYGPLEYLNGDYTIFGQVVSGMDVVNGITRRDPDQNPGFSGDMIETITITEQ